MTPSKPALAAASRERASPALATITPWWRGAVIYQIYPRSFKDSNEDGVGDLKGAIEKLGHVAALGVDAVWLSPFFASPMKDFGYDISDYCAVDPIFGSLDDFDAFIVEAKRLKLRVIIDQVYSHTSDQHAWFSESRESRHNQRADWYVWADPKQDGSPPNNWQSVFGGPAWTWDSRRQQYYLHNFLSSQPDLNLHNRAVQDAVLDVARFWLRRGVDGFRLDAVNFSMHDPLLRDNPPAPRAGRTLTRPFDYQLHVRNQSHPDIPPFLQRIRAVTEEYRAFTVAEVGGPEPLAEMKAFTADDDKLHSAYNFAFLYANRLTPELTADAVGVWRGDQGEGWPSWAFSNHDAPRAVSRWAAEGDFARAAKLHGMLLLSLRGNAFLYQGEELGLPQADVPRHLLKDPEAIANWPLTLGRDGARTPMPWMSDAANGGFSRAEPWLPVDQRHLRLAVDRQEKEPDSPLAFFRRMISLRKRSDALRLGDIEFLFQSDGVLAFVRRWKSAQALCVFNLGDSVQRWRCADTQGFARALDCGLESGGDLPEALPPLSGYVALRGD